MKFIPLSIPNFEGNEQKYVDDAITQGWVSTGGAYITKLEDMLADFVHTEAVVACQSGTSGLHLALIEAGVMPDDVVIVPTLTFIAAVNPVRYQFAQPVFMDCDDSLCMDADKLSDFCEEECLWDDGKLLYRKNGKCVKAIVVVHVFGNMANMEAIMDIADKYNLKVIEDATEALGTYYSEGRYAGKYAGTIGDFGVFSFNGNKIITTGGGGAIVAKDKTNTSHIRYLSTQAKDDTLFYIHNEVGYNYRMTNVQAALGVAQMELLNDFIKRKQENFEYYKELFDGYECGEMLSFRAGTNSNHWFYSLKFDVTKTDFTLEQIIDKLSQKNIQTRAIWGLIHEQAPYKKYSAYKIEMAKKISSCVINLPCSTNISREEILYVAENIKEIVK